MASTATLMGYGFPEEQALLLGDFALISRPTTAMLMEAGFPPALADVLGNQWIAGNVPTAIQLMGYGMGPQQASILTSGATAPVGSPAVLASLTVSPLFATAGTPWTATISGNTTGSYLSATSSDGTVLTVSGTTISGTFSASGSPNVSVNEALAGAVGSPKVTVVTITVSAAAQSGSSGTADFSQAANSNLIAAIAA